ncbi:MAG: hypothetical protein M3R68_09920 [Acidobacteriota bacterium]|nr:hypothetical protein [Acidobacteriota bacterium]
MATAKPTKMTLRAYQVGFGDCFLLTFHYPKNDRHVLIDFGSTGVPKGSDPKLMLHVAEDIEKECGGKLHAVVATHRHKDHISGFATSKGKGSGDVIARCKPDVFVQPWTEDPKAKKDAKEATKDSTPVQHFTASLQNMQQVSASIFEESKAMRRQGSNLGIVDQLSFIGDDNIANLSAIENLMTMAQKRNTYVHFGSKSGLETVLPGVKIHVLGPPNLKQTGEILKERSKDAAEFWMFQAFAGDQENVRGGDIFPRAQSVSGNQTAPNARWFVRHLRSVRGEQLLGLVRSLDQAMNNTSVILLFEIGKQKFLFPGDAQIENWNYALTEAKKDPDLMALLKQVNLYKVGHHGSRNATPISLWNLFANRSKKQSPKRLQTVVSTMAGKHGHADVHTEVPRASLVKALKAESAYFTTQDLKGKTTIRKDVVLDL